LFFLCLFEGGGYCCFFGSWFCFLCVLCSFCWEEDLSVYCYWTLHTFGKSISSLYLVFDNEICDCCFLIHHFGFFCLFFVSKLCLQSGLVCWIVQSIVFWNCLYITDEGIRVTCFFVFLLCPFFNHFFWVVAMWNWNLIPRL